ncbi:vascular endothelial growth factor receptor 1 isoform X2 [Folsomia candida]|uniref:vascular endothelial growth factor receptor 1 isoform X2 n=1 Tax=Folsomia candida TaxID=158441 RepID=UPI0016051379|nr:vascular endothelial growth factor receptor 1 isoform X2 [Folsomia candida]
MSIASFLRPPQRHIFYHKVISFYLDFVLFNVYAKNLYLKFCVEVTLLFLFLRMRIFKDRFEPCCGFSLRWAVRLMSILNVLMVLVGGGLCIRDVFQLWNKWEIEKVENRKDYYTRLGLWIAYAFHIITSIPADYLLFHASKTENICYLRICFFSTLINTTFSLIVYYFHTFYFGLHVPTLAIFNGYLFYKYYECAVINYFIKEIKLEKEFSSSKRVLTDAELQEFEEGIFPPPFDIETKALLEKVNYERFKKEEYEIHINQLRFDTSDNILGQGAYGCVYRAQLEKNDGYTTTVAVKMINPEDTDVVYFKALLTEVKIMSCIGKHENIIQLIGATTREIRQRKLNMVLEFCAFGNMTDYLRGCRGLYRNLVKNGEVVIQKSHYDTTPFNEFEIVSTKDLIRWSYEIARGMEYLELKKVIHGDLATRNILLNSKRIPKISDFGLARQLYAYSVRRYLGVIFLQSP